MGVSGTRVSLVISTLNRTTELKRLFDSLLAQEVKDFEIVVADQNDDDRIVPILRSYEAGLRIRRICTPGRRGVSSGRNDGWRSAQSDVVLFPDDDCWFPNWFLRKGLEVLDRTGAELVSGRFADESGRSINGRFSSQPQRITRRNVWTAQSESATFYRRDLLERLGGFDEKLGIGSASEWQAAEGPNLILRALQMAGICYYEPSLYGHHREYDLDDPSGEMTNKGRAYGRGMGHVLRTHRYGFLSLVYWASRPLATALIAAMRGQFHRMAYALSVSLGRVEGWTGRIWSVGDRHRHAPATMSDNGTADFAARDRDATVCFGKKRREMTGPYVARNPFLVTTLYIIDGLARLAPKRSGQAARGQPLRVLVANWGHLGDVVTILPVLKYLEASPNVGELGVLIGSWSLPVLEASDIAARIHVIDHWALDRGNQSVLRKFGRYLLQWKILVHELRRHRYDMSIDIFASFPATHWITWSASISRRVGFRSSGLGPLLTDPFDWTPDHEILLDHQLKLLKPLVGDSFPKALSASYPGFAFSPARPPLGTGRRPYIVINMGAAGIKAWVPEKWVSLVAALRARGYDVVATGGPGREAEVARAVRKDTMVRDLTGQQSWAQFVATVAGAAGVVTIDSVAAHIAACFDVPTAVLSTGRSRFSLWRPNSPYGVALTHVVGCAPCHRTRGCATMACVKFIEVHDVLESLQTMMREKRSNSSKSLSSLN